MESINNEESIEGKLLDSRNYQMKNFQIANGIIFQFQERYVSIVENYRVVVILHKGKEKYICKLHSSNEYWGMKVDDSRILNNSKVWLLE
jgi:hypothetical protein